MFLDRIISCSKISHLTLFSEVSLNFKSKMTISGTAMLRINWEEMKFDIYIK